MKAMARVGSMGGGARGIDAAHGPLTIWLYALAGLVLAMVIVGGATRLTGSGLSITEWRPIIGALPPLSAADWQEAFDKYRQIRQYQLVNSGMSLDAFQTIYWWEWSHRQLGRLIGLAYVLPLAVFWSRGMIPAGFKPRLAGVGLLGLLQGALGWYMVQSGLADRTEVSQYRLALHLTLAAIIFAALLRLAFALGPDARRRIRLQTLPAGATLASAWLVTLILAQIFLGALVAGTRAGLSHNTWPLMDGALWPDGLAAMTPWWLNAFENVAAIQFNHRLLAYAIAALALWHGVRVAGAADDERVRISVRLLAGLVIAQAALGIWTLLAHVTLPLALAHQAGAMLVLAAAVWHRFAIANS